MYSLEDLDLISGTIKGKNLKIIICLQKNYIHCLYCPDNSTTALPGLSHNNISDIQISLIIRAP